MILQTDKYQFVLIHNLDELTQARKDGRAQVKAVCPGCQKEILVHPGEAELIIENGCIQHPDTVKHPRKKLNT